jgi:hypothetical protein
VVSEVAMIANEIGTGRRGGQGACGRTRFPSFLICLLIDPVLRAK